MKLAKLPFLIREETVSIFMANCKTPVDFLPETEKMHLWLEVFMIRKRLGKIKKVFWNHRVRDNFAIILVFVAND